MIELKTISQLILEDSSASTKYGCLMIQFDYDLPAIKKLIDKADLCEKEGGIETESHVTVLYGFHDIVDPKDVLDFVKKKANWSNLKTIALDRVSLFKNKGFDVLKFDVKESEFYKLNKLVCNEFEYTNKYPIYHAHATIAYLQPGCGDKYVKKLSSMKLVGTPTRVLYSTAKKKKSSFEI